MIILSIVQGNGRTSRHDLPPESSATRIGSHPLCPVRFPEIEPHAVTVERRGAGHVVHNRTQRELGLDGRALAAGGSAPWPVGAELKLRSDLILTLDEVEPSRTAGGWSPAGAQQRSSHAPVFQALLTLACLGASAYLVVPARDQAKLDATTSRLLAELRESDEIGRAVAKEVVEATRAGRLADQLGRLGHLRRANDLLLNPPALDDTTLALHDRARIYVREELSRP